MKMLCSGSDLTKLERVRKRLIRAGVTCELRQDYSNPDAPGMNSELPCYPELWLQRDEDYPIASTILTSPGAVGRALRA
jgi:hypothetical protein